MTTHNEEPPAADRPPRQVASQAGSPTPPAAGTGEGGPQMREAAPEEPSSATRSPRAPHIEEAARPAVMEQPAAVRAMVRKAQRRRSQRGQVNRRQFMGASFWGVMGLGLTSGLAAFLAMFWPRGITGFGGKIAVAAILIPEAGTDPVRVIVGKFWLTHLQPGEGVHAGFGQPGEGGLLALWWKCPHLGCTVPWRPDFAFEGETGYFRCPCHGSTYTKAGVRVFGPAPRPLDTMAITVNVDGSLTVDTGVITKGGTDNPKRTVPYT